MKASAKIGFVFYPIFYIGHQVLNMIPIFFMSVI